MYCNLTSKYLYLSPFQTEIVFIEGDREKVSLRFEFEFNKPEEAKIARDSIMRGESIAVRLNMHEKIQKLKGYAVSGVSQSGSFVAAWLYIDRGLWE